MQSVTFYFLFALSLAAVFIYQFLKKKKLDPGQYKQLYNIFYRHPITTPTLEIQQITWLPRFTVTFNNKSDYEYAKNHGLIDTLNNQIKDEFYDIEFRVEQSITYRWTS